MKTTAQRIKELRTAKGMTQDELAEKLGLNRSAIAKYENGLVENIKRATIDKMANLFDVKPSYLLGYTDDSSQIESADSFIETKNLSEDELNAFLNNSINNSLNKLDIDQKFELYKYISEMVKK